MNLRVWILGTALAAVVGALVAVVGGASQEKLAAGRESIAAPDYPRPVRRREAAFKEHRRNARGDFTPARLTEGDDGQGPPAGSVWTEPASGMEFVWVPGGCFVMGARDGEDDERPRHEVCVDGFYMGRYEVTQDQYYRLTGTNPSRFDGADLPVEEVTWHDARDFADALAARSGTAIRLPTEAEWEYACRAGQQTDVCGRGDAEELAWYVGNSGARTHPVGRKRPNQWGLYDMGGNVWEWVEDCYHDSYDGAPSDGSAWTTGGDCSWRMKRGGSWNHVPFAFRSANRSWCDVSFRRSKIGFRVAMALP